MKKYTVPQLITLLGMPALTVVLGLILLVNPDIASVLIGKVLGWACVLGALVFAFRSRSGNNRPAVAGSVILGALGVWMLTNPLFLAGIMGRVLGFYLLLRGLQDGRMDLKMNSGKVIISTSLILAAVMALIGLVLILVPLATSRMVFSIIGILMICVGIAECADRIRGRKLLDEGSDPNIIDVEKL
jgi:uncharacterized membrane protein HdeD (DUF308 family)